MVLVSTHREVRSILAQNKINFTIVMPSIDQKEDYMSRYRQRVGHPLSPDVMDKNWKLFIGDCLSDKHAIQHTILSPGQTLADFLEEVSDPIGQVCGSFLTDVDLSVYNSLMKITQKITPSDYHDHGFIDFVLSETFDVLDIEPIKESDIFKVVITKNDNTTNDTCVKFEIYIEIERIVGFLNFKETLHNSITGIKEFQFVTDTTISQYQQLLRCLYILGKAKDTVKVEGLRIY